MRKLILLLAVLAVFLVTACTRLDSAMIPTVAERAAPVETNVSDALGCVHDVMYGGNLGWQKRLDRSLFLVDRVSDGMADERHQSRSKISKSGRAWIRGAILKAFGNTYVHVPDHFSQAERNYFEKGIVSKQDRKILMDRFGAGNIWTLKGVFPALSEPLDHTGSATTEGGPPSLKAKLGFSKGRLSRLITFNLSFGSYYLGKAVISQELSIVANRHTSTLKVAFGSDQIAFSFLDNRVREESLAIAQQTMVEAAIYQIAAQLLEIPPALCINTDLRPLASKIRLVRVFAAVDAETRLSMMSQEFDRFDAYSHTAPYSDDKKFEYKLKRFEHQINLIGLRKRDALRFYLHLLAQPTAQPLRSSRHG